MRPVRESVSLHETRNAECDICGALLGDAEKHAEWHEEQFYPVRGGVFEQTYEAA